MSTPWEMQPAAPKGSVLSTALYNLYINDPPETPKLVTRVYILQIATEVMFPESCNAATLQWILGVKTGT